VLAHFLRDPGPRDPGPKEAVALRVMVGGVALRPEPAVSRPAGAPAGTCGRSGHGLGLRRNRIAGDHHRFSAVCAGGFKGSSQPGWQAGMATGRTRGVRAVRASGLLTGPAEAHEIEQVLARCRSAMTATVAPASARRPSRMPRAEASGSTGSGLSQSDHVSRCGSRVSSRRAPTSGRAPITSHYVGGERPWGIPHPAPPVGPIRAAARAADKVRARLSAPSARLVQTWAEPSGERRAWRSG
jgi:hypothetical protein